MFLRNIFINNLPKHFFCRRDVSATSVSMSTSFIACDDSLFVSLFLAQQPQWVRDSSFARFLDHTQRRTTVCRTPLDECSARRRNLYLTTHNTHNRQTSMPPVGFEPTISSGERPQTYGLHREASGTGEMTERLLFTNPTYVPTTVKFLFLLYVSAIKSPSSRSITRQVI